MKAHDDGVPPPELMPISAFARRCGLTASALRFYDDYGLLSPACVDAVTGYRHYSSAQVARGEAIRRLRELDLPLAEIGRALAASPDDAARLVDEHLSAAGDELARKHRAAAEFTGSLRHRDTQTIASLPGPLLAAAVEQVLTATAHTAEAPALAGVRIEATGDALVLTATDRYRLATRSLALAEPPSDDWAGTADGDELSLAISHLRRAARIELDAGTRELWLRADGAVPRRCRLLFETFPDHRLLLDSLEPATTRLVVPQHELLSALEHHGGERIALNIAESGIVVASSSGETVVTGTHTGTDVYVAFELTTLYPAVATAIGPDLMVDLRGPDRPATVRSADRGDLTTLVMPVHPD